METATAAQHHSVSSWVCMLNIPASPFACTPMGGLTAISWAPDNVGGSVAWPEQSLITMGPMTTGQLGRDPPEPGPPPTEPDGPAGPAPPTEPDGPAGPDPPTEPDGPAGPAPPTEPNGPAGPFPPKSPCPL